MDQDGTAFEVVRSAEGGITVRRRSGGSDIVFSIATNGGPRELVLVSGEGNAAVGDAMAFARREAQRRGLL